MTEIPCPDCDGLGYITGQVGPVTPFQGATTLKCPTCLGSGWLKKATKKIQVRHGKHFTYIIVGTGFYYPSSHK
jgi:hypothetical protein